ncbi:hypothetical protein EAMG_03895 [Escherichia coli M056]|uniref:hypothetical protein n=1 Tax=Escherichia coli TaxID=562 RepID=UPI000A185CFF|nr:hypothetical protein [Escherichia coli]OSK22856.1 hypothetical protein EAMG_03895 [Escherichia coli M056]
MTCQGGVSGDVRFRIYVSWYIEFFSATFYCRIERLCYFLLLLSGSAVMGERWNVQLAGALIVFISCYLSIRKPGIVGDNAARQACVYSTLIDELDHLDKEAVMARLKKAEITDTPAPLLAIRKMARIQACITTGNHRTAEEEMKKLSFSRRVIIWFAGGIQH